MTRRFAVGIRTKLLAASSVFLLIPWLGFEYVSELERFLRDQQLQKLAGTAEAVATALHERPRLFERPGADLAALQDREITDAGAAALPNATRRLGHPARPGSSAEIEQILAGLTRTTARIWVVDRNLRVLAVAGTLRRIPPDPDVTDSSLGGVGTFVERRLLGPIYRMVLTQPREDFADDLSEATVGRYREVQRALTGIPTNTRRPTPDARAVIVSAAHPIWVGYEVRGVVLVEETTNALLADRNRAFERLFNLVLAVVLAGSATLFIFASRLSGRIRRLRDEAERAIDAHGRVTGKVTPSRAGDELGDLSRSFASALDRLGEYAAYQEAMGSRLSHELRTPIAVVRTSLENLALAPITPESRIYIERAQDGIARLSSLLAAMSEATRLEHMLREAERERFDLARVVAGCVEGYRSIYAGRRFDLRLPEKPVTVLGVPDLVAQMLDKLIANAADFGRPEAPITIRLAPGDFETTLTVANEGPPLPEEMRGRLFESMVSVRGNRAGGVPHLGLGLYIVRLIAEFHGGRASASNREDVEGVVVKVSFPPEPFIAD
jgi:two-component system, OmpR family, sensor histidine kinase ChvG